MHRSGTSLVSRKLHEHGLFLGFRLLGKGVSNPGGHYEDRAFIELHRAILAEHALTHEVESLPRFEFGESHLKQAARIVALRELTHRQWGWKDPRTCLFVPLWESVIDEPHYLVIFRDPEEVIQSYVHREYVMNRAKHSRFDIWRGRYAFDEETQQAIAHRVARMWLVYNAAILRDVIYKNRKYALLHFSDFVVHQLLPHELVDWGFELRHFTKPQLDSKKVRKVAHFEISIDPGLKKECRELYQEMLGLLN